MRNKRLSVRLNLALFAVTGLMTGVRAGAQTEQVAHGFVESAGDGAMPDAGLVTDAAGNLYGTTSSGGATFQNLGAVFELSPVAGGGWTETLIHTFTGGADGEYPQSGVILDKAGNLYGTTQGDGATSVGTVFELTPTAGGSWTETILLSFKLDGSKGAFPRGSLIFDAAGNLYGTAAVGGAYNEGAIFELMPNGSGGWTEKVLHNFANNGKDGQIPNGSLIFDAAGNLYGATGAGGVNNGGTVFELSPKAGGGWAEKILHNFSHNGQDGYAAWGNLIFDAAGNLYGTTSKGGSHPCNCGIVFELAPKASGRWVEEVVHSLHNSDGWYPIGGVILDAAGNLYGTAYQGGAYNSGTAFKLSPAGNGVWTETVLHNFGSGTDGQNPFAPVIFGPGGNLYGTTLYGGGTLALGTVFEITP